MLVTAHSNKCLIEKTSDKMAQKMQKICFQIMIKNLLPDDFPMVLLDVFFVLGDIGPDDGGDVEGGRLNRPGSISLLRFTDDTED